MWGVVHKKVKYVGWSTNFSIPPPLRISNGIALRSLMAAKNHHPPFSLIISFLTPKDYSWDPSRTTLDIGYSFLKRTTGV